ncbi:hypothetical protein PFISCL1PPCAC_20653, partial [Pristionchus fissidentatus]
RNKLTTHCGGPMISFDKLLNSKEGFINDDKIIVEARIKIKSVSGLQSKAGMIDFSSPSPGSDNVILIVEGKRVHVGKQILALHSPHFNTMFYENDELKDKEEIELKDVKFEEFIDLLKVFHPSHQPITIDSVVYILRLAKRFQMTYVIDQALSYLIETDKLTDAKKLRIAKQYGMKTLERYITNEHTRRSYSQGKLFTRVRPVLDFTSPPPGNDAAILIVEGKKVHVGTQFLAIHSPYFNTMFYGDFAEKNKEEIELNDVRYEEFIELLNILYPSDKKITVDSVRYILPLAQYYNFQWVTDKAVSYLKSTKDASKATKLVMANKYGLKELELEVMLMLNGREIKDLKKSGNFKEGTV